MHAVSSPESGVLGYIVQPPCVSQPLPSSSQLDCPSTRIWRYAHSIYSLPLPRVWSSGIYLRTSGSYSYSVFQHKEAERGLARTMHRQTTSRKLSETFIQDQPGDHACQLLVLGITIRG